MKKSLLILILVIVLFPLGYWLKCQMGMNLVGRLSLQRLPPFRYLQREDVVTRPEPGSLFRDSFESLEIIAGWSQLWMREKGKVTLTHDSRGMNDSRCLLVRSVSEKDWSVAHNKLIQVREGEVFGFRGSVRVEGEKATALIGVTSYDRYRKAISWNYEVETVTERGTWVAVERTFHIPKGIVFIGFRVAGFGPGVYRFDDIDFWKEGP